MVLGTLAMQNTQRLLSIFSAIIFSAIITCFWSMNVLAQSEPNSTSPKVLNLYSARHYQTDEALYNDFTKKTGIKINRIEADDNA